MKRAKRTILVFGDQLNRNIGALREADPSTASILMVESAEKIGATGWHRQRLHFYLSSMRHFASELEAEGFTVDYRIARSFRQAIRDHQAEHPDADMIATEPNSWTARALLRDLDISTRRSDQFLMHHDDFVAWVDSRRSRGYKTFKMEDFYRHQRQRLGVLMAGDEPVGGRWNFDESNRQPPPRDGHDRWPAPEAFTFDEIDRDILAALPESAVGTLPNGTWATSRDGALKRLGFFVENLLPLFGPHEDAMLTGNWHLAHSLLSPYLNNGLLLPGEVVAAATRAFEAGDVPIESVEGFIRQVIGWREYVWGLYWMWMPGYRNENALGADLPLPPLFSDGSTRMNCMSQTLAAVDSYAWSHHIQRLMVLGNFALTAGINPRQFTDWMSRVFVDAADWVMVPNVVGMALHADGGKMATKPYASGGAYIDKMSDYCKGCAYDRKARTGELACPFTTLYWDFLDRHHDRFIRNARVATQARAARKLTDLDSVRARAVEVRRLLAAGEL